MAILYVNGDIFNAYKRPASRKNSPARLIKFADSEKAH